MIKIALDTNVIVDLFDFEKTPEKFLSNRSIKLKRKVAIKYLYNIMKEELSKGRFQELYLSYTETVEKELYSLSNRDICPSEVFNFTRKNDILCLKTIKDNDVQCADYLFRVFKGKHNLYPDFYPLFSHNQKYDFFIFSDCVTKNVSLITSDRLDLIGGNGDVRNEIKRRIDLAKSHINKLFKNKIDDVEPLTPYEFIEKNFPKEYNKMEKEINDIKSKKINKIVQE